MQCKTAKKKEEKEETRTMQKHNKRMESNPEMSMQCVRSEGRIIRGSRNRKRYNERVKLYVCATCRVNP